MAVRSKPITRAGWDLATRTKHQRVPWLIAGCWLTPLPWWQLASSTKRKPLPTSMPITRKISRQTVMSVRAQFRQTAPPLMALRGPRERSGHGKLPHPSPPSCERCRCCSIDLHLLQGDQAGRRIWSRHLLAQRVTRLVQALPVQAPTAAPAPRVCIDRGRRSPTADRGGCSEGACSANTCYHAGQPLTAITTSSSN